MAGMACLYLGAEAFATEGGVCVAEPVYLYLGAKAFAAEGGV